MTEKKFGVIHDFLDWQHPLLFNQSKARAKVYLGLNYEFVGTEAALPTVLKAVGVTLHPAIGMGPKKKNLSETPRRETAVCGRGREDVKEGAERPSALLDSGRPLLPAQESNSSTERVQIANAHSLRSNLFQKSHLQVTATQPTIGLLQPSEAVTPHTPMLAYEPVPSSPDSGGDPRPAARSTALPAGAGGSNPLVHADRAHAEYSPSSLKAKSVCPGFRNDPDGDTTAADRGSKGHLACEREDASICGDDAQLTAAAEKCIAYARKITAGMERHREIKVEYPGGYGHVDEAAVKGSLAKILDFKFSWNPYQADEFQFFCYAVGIFDMFPHVETVEIHVIHGFLGFVDTETWTRKGDYDRLCGLITAAITRAKRNDPADYRASRLCAFCGHAGTCPKLAKMGVEIAARYEPSLELPAEGSLHGSEIDDPETFAKLIPLSSVIQKAASGWTRAATNLIDGGAEIPGYELGHRAGKRSVASAKAAFDVVKQIVPKMEVGDFLEHATVSASGLDEIVRAAAPRGDKAKAVARLAALLEDADILNAGSESRYLKKVKV